MKSSLDLLECSLTIKSNGLTSKTIGNKKRKLFLKLKHPLLSSLLKMKIKDKNIKLPSIYKERKQSRLTKLIKKWA